MVGRKNFDELLDIHQTDLSKFSTIPSNFCAMYMHGTW